jgi:16S rRNA (cytidine1402-2'-O)-methyltransferase
VTGLLVLAGAPIGDWRDASRRLIEELTLAEVIAAEDTRRFARLARDLGVTYTGRLISYFDGNEIAKTGDLVAELLDGRRVLLITDAGMPSVSDPGYRLVRAALNAGIRVTAVPGPSAVLTALALSGLPSDRFIFEGFVPRTKGARESFYRGLSQERRTVVLFEAPHRLAESLEDALSELGPDRKAAICREMTKTYEEIIRGSLAQLVAWSKSEEILGEITLVIAGVDPSVREVDSTELVQMVTVREAAGLSRKEAIAAVAEALSLAKRVVFDAVVAEKESKKQASGKIGE